MSEGFVQNSEIVLADASASVHGLGKITTLAASATNYIRLNCDRNVSKVDWQVKANKKHTVQLYRARANVLGGTITLTDATAVDDGDTFIFNGETYTAEATESDALTASRKFWTGANNAAAAANLAALISHATYGVPGIGVVSVAAVDATDVITIAPGSATVYQFNQGTSAANEIAWAETSLASLVKHGAAYTGLADNSTTAGTTYEQWQDGWDYSYLAITNNDAADAMTYTIKATRYWA